MKNSRQFLLVLVAILLAGASLTLKPPFHAKAAAPLDDFLQRRQSVYSVLQQRVNAPPDGVRLRLPKEIKDDASLPEYILRFSDNDHVRRVIEDSDWRSNATFQLLLELNEAALPEGKQGDSNTMAATILLNHYFSELERLGFRNQGTPDVVVSGVQSARNTWFIESDRTISVTGVVFVSPASKQAIVIATISEQLESQ